MNISIYGHNHLSIFCYTLDGVFYENPQLYGVQLIQFIARDVQTKIVDMPPEDIISKVNNSIFSGENADEFYREYFVVRRYETNTNKNYYAISRHLGCRKGKSSHSILSIPPIRKDEPMDLVVWDYGLGGLSLPDNCRTVMWASEKTLPDAEQFNSIADKCFYCWTRMCFVPLER